MKYEKQLLPLQLVRLPAAALYIVHKSKLVARKQATNRLARIVPFLKVWRLDRGCNKQLCVGHIMTFDRLEARHMGLSRRWSAPTRCLHHRVKQFRTDPRFVCVDGVRSIDDLAPFGGY